MQPAQLWTGTDPTLNWNRPVWNGSWSSLTILFIDSPPSPPHQPNPPPPHLSLSLCPDPLLSIAAKTQHKKGRHNWGKEGKRKERRKKKKRKKEEEAKHRKSFALVSRPVFPPTGVQQRVSSGAEHLTPAPPPPPPPPTFTHSPEISVSMRKHYTKTACGWSLCSKHLLTQLSRFSDNESKLIDKFVLFSLSLSLTFIYSMCVLVCRRLENVQMYH